MTEKTLKMENEQDLKIQKEIEDALNPMYQSQPLPDFEEEEVKIEVLAEKSPDIYPTENSIAKRQKVRYLATRIKYSPTRVKSRNFLSNIGYTSINKSDFYNENFILDVYILLVKNLNPFSLQRKISDKFKHEMIYMLWREYIPVEFYRYICQEENFKYLNGRDVNQPGVLEIVGRFIDQGKKNLFGYLQRYFSVCLFSRVPRDLHDVRKTRDRHQKQLSQQAIRHQQLAKQMSNYENEQVETCEFEQKPIARSDEFNNEEEMEMKEI